MGNGATASGYGKIFNAAKIVQQCLLRNETKGTKFYSSISTYTWLLYDCHCYDCYTAIGLLEHESKLRCLSGLVGGQRSPKSSEGTPRDNGRSGSITSPTGVRRHHHLQPIKLAESGGVFNSSVVSRFPKRDQVEISFAGWLNNDAYRKVDAPNAAAAATSARLQLSGLSSYFLFIFRKESIWTYSTRKWNVPLNS